MFSIKFQRFNLEFSLLFQLGFRVKSSITNQNIFVSEYHIKIIYNWNKIQQLMSWVRNVENTYIILRRRKNWQTLQLHSEIMTLYHLGNNYEMDILIEDPFSSLWPWQLTHWLCHLKKWLIKLSQKKKRKPSLWRRAGKETSDNNDSDLHTITANALYVTQKTTK